MMMLRPAGDAAVLIDTDLPAAQLAAAITAAGLPGIRDVVPGARTVLVITDPGVTRQASFTRRLAALPVSAAGSATAPAIEIPVCYDGPDLAEVARLTSLPVAGVIEAHAAGHYLVGWLGFSPGFGYLTGLDQRLATVPRLSTPRLAVPAGSVAIAAGLTAVYPSASAGGWLLLGRTGVRLWDKSRDPAALLSPGQQVRFRPVDSIGPEPAPSAGQRHRSGQRQTRYLEVVRTGPLASVQDLGRNGYGSIGVRPAGAADTGSLIAGNRLVGNQAGAAGIELTLGRAAFRCAGGATVAVTGAPAEVSITVGAAATRPARFGRAIQLPDDAVISVGAPHAGLRSYLTVAGGVTVPAVLGSRSADLLAGLGGSQLRPGDQLPIGPPADQAAAPTGPAPYSRWPATVMPVRGEVVELRVLGGPRLDWFDSAAFSLLCDASYLVTPASNRTGLRLQGAPLNRAGDAELPSEGMVTGALQVPPDGQPILLLADRPTTGGYPVIAVVLSSDLGVAAQLRPGDRVRFTGSSR